MLTHQLDPIYKSVDGGATWSNFSAVKDTQNGWGMRFQPFLYTLPTDFGGYARGTILAAGVRPLKASKVVYTLKFMQVKMVQRPGSLSLTLRMAMDLIPSRMAIKHCGSLSS